MINYLPSLTDAGWLDQTDSIVDTLFSDYLASDYSQSHLYYGNVSSFAKAVMEGGTDIATIINKVQSSMYNYFNRFLDNVQVDVREYVEVPGSGRTSLSLYVGFTDRDGKQKTLGRILENIQDPKSGKIIKLNNDGV